MKKMENDIKESIGSNFNSTAILIIEEQYEKQRSGKKIWWLLLCANPGFYLMVFLTLLVPPIGLIGLAFFAYIMKKLAVQVETAANERAELERQHAQAKKTERNEKAERVEEIVQRRLEEERQKEQEVE